MSGPRRIAPGRIIQDVAGAIALLRGKDHAHAASGGVKGQQMPPLPMHINASMLMMDFFVGSALGYPFWIIAARLFDPADVGLGSAALSGLRLCMLLALIGIGSAIVLLLPRDEHDPSDVVSTALMLAVTSGLAVAVGFIVITGVLLGELKQLASSPLYAGAFLLLNGVMVITRTLDSTFMGLRRSDRVLVRSIVQGTLALGALVLLSFVTGNDGLLSILGAWILGLAASVALGFSYLRRALPELSLRLQNSHTKVREITRIGLPNFALRLSMAVPVNVIPIVVVEVLTPTAGAYWYAVWMFAMIALTVPGATSNALFAEASNRPEQLNASARQGIRFALTVSVPAALAIGIGAPLGLSLMGQGYAAAGTTPLRIVVLGVIPNTMIAAYVARQRVAGQLREPTLFSIFSSALSVLGAIVGGKLFGLTGIAVAWLLAQSVAGAWAAWKVSDLYTAAPREQPEASPAASQTSGEIHRAAETVSVGSRGMQR